MTRRKIKLTATFDQVLIDAGIPQLVLFKAVGKTKVIAIAIREFKDFECPYFAAQISSDQFEEYLDEKFDLRYLLMKPDSKNHFVCDLAKLDDNDVIELFKIKFPLKELEPFLPNPGVFARAHTEDLDMKDHQPLTEQIFGVDGSWNLNEFSKFYNYVTDVYALYDCMDVYLNDNTTPLHKRQIKEAFIKPFEGGGSYVSLYDNLALSQPIENRLKVGGINYNSPGTVRLKGFEKPFRELKTLIIKFDTHASEMEKEYKSLHQFLAQHGFLKMPAEKYRAKDDVAKEIKLRTKVLAAALEVSPETVYKMSGEHVLITAKVVLSIYRRAQKLHEFFLEGRASFDIPTSQS